MPDPRVSVVLLTYNQERFVGDALDCLAKQTFNDYEIVVADDGSTDQTREIAGQRASDLPIRIVTGPNLGIAGNWARAMPYCSGEFVMIHAADDLLLPNHLELAVKSLEEEPAAGLSYCRQTLVDEGGVNIEIPPTLKRADIRTGWVDPIELLRWNYIGGSGVVMRRQAVESVGGVDPTLVFADLDLFVRLASRYPICYVSESTFLYRIHDGGLHTDFQANLEWRLRMYDKHLGRDWTPLKKKMVAEAYVRTAYRQLWPNPSAASAKQARSNLRRALVTSPMVLLDPLGAAMVSAATLGSVYVRAANRLGGWFAYSDVKLRLQRILGVAR